MGDLVHGSQDKSPSPVARVLGRLAAAVVGGLLVFWAFVILRNIWGYNDSGTFLYVVYAVVYGVPGLMLLLVAIGVLPRRRTSEGDPV